MASSPYRLHSLTSQFDFLRHTYACIPIFNSISATLCWLRGYFSHPKIQGPPNSGESAHYCWPSTSFKDPNFLVRI